MNETIQERDGKLFIMTKSRSFDEPITICNYYAIGVASKHYQDRIGLHVRYAQSGGGVYYDLEGQAYRLEHGGQTKPTYSETIPIEKPKTRLQIRYVRGRWEKLTSKGWKIA